MLQYLCVVKVYVMNGVRVGVIGRLLGACVCVILPRTLKEVCKRNNHTFSE